MYRRMDDGINSAFEIPIHECTEQDFEKFYPVDAKGEPRLREMRKSPGRSLNCLDWEALEGDLYGEEVTGNIGFIDIVVMPCNVKLTQKTLGGSEDRIGEECIWDREKQREYLQPPNLIAYFNQERLNIEEYGD